MAGKFGFWMRSSYSASKHALHGFFESLRAELHHANIQVTLVCPGRINTPISVTSLTGTGQPYGIMDEGQINGVSAEKCARKIARAISCNRKEIFIGSAERLLLIIKRFCPSLFYRILNGLEPK
jgi:short-subunit dehydrogenase